MKTNLSGRCVMFDLDGTLADTADDLAAAMNAALEADGLAPAPADAVRHLVGHGARAMLTRGYEIAAGEAADDPTLDRALKLFLEHYEANIAVHTRPYDGAVSLLDALRAAGAATAICTNKRERLATVLIAALGLSDRFDVIVGADTAAAPKPDAAPLRHCLAATGAQRGVLIGDSDTDIRAGLAAGAPVFAATFGYGPLALIEQAAGRFAAYAELEAPLFDALRRA